MIIYTQLFQICIIVMTIALHRLILLFALWLAVYCEVLLNELAFLLFQKNDIAMAVTKYDQFDFLIDIVPRDEIKATKRQVSNRLMFLVNMTCFIKVGGHDGERDKRRERCHILAFEHI